MNEYTVEKCSLCGFHWTCPECDGIPNTRYAGLMEAAKMLEEWAKDWEVQINEYPEGTTRHSEHRNRNSAVARELKARADKLRHKAERIV